MLADFFLTLFEPPLPQAGACCSLTTHSKLAECRGDLNPYKQGQGRTPVDGFLPVCIICILSLGTLAPFLINYNPPPVSKSTRYPTQRRMVPAGYPNQIENNEEVKKQVMKLIGKKEPVDAKELNKFANDLPEEKFNELWDNTLTYTEVLSAATHPPTQIPSALLHRAHGGCFGLACARV
jgi:hypothetical protein